MGEEREESVAIEEHARREHVSPSILAAVMQFQNWAEGKKVSKTVFKDGVNAFLEAPIGGVEKNGIT